MYEPRVSVLALTLLTTACSGLTALPSSPSSVAFPQNASISSPATAASTPAPAHTIGPDVPAGLTPSTRTVNGTVGPLASYPAPCYVGMYACERYDFTLHRQGAVEVTLSWQGGSRAMLIQLYRAGAGLVHEDVAPPDGAPSITFRRTGLEAMDYELRVVNWEPDVAHAFTMTITTWQ